MTRKSEIHKATEPRARSQAEAQRLSGLAASAPRSCIHPKGATPSNTAPTNYTDAHTSIIRSGIDSLYLSWPGALDQAFSERLERLKAKAQSPIQVEHQEAVCKIIGHRFEVLGSGRRSFAFVLRDNWFDIQLSRPSAKAIPLALVQISSEVLSKSGYIEPTVRVSQLINHLGTPQAQKVSRVDLCVDFLTECDISKISEDAWVTRAEDIKRHSVKRKFSGWSIGYGGNIKCRLYNKTLEIERSKKSFFYELWKEKGWQGEYPVWRLEFEIRRAVLKQLGIESTEDFNEKLNGLWQYAIQDWLRLTVPSASDTLKSRWPEHPMWKVLRQARFGTGSVVPLRRIRKERFPSSEFLYVNALGGLTSFMAQEGINSLPAAIQLYMERASAFHRNRRSSEYSLKTYVERKVGEKRRKFNIGNPATEKGKSASEYRKAKEGE